MELNELEKQLQEFYIKSVKLKKYNSYVELYLPIYLDDMVMFSLFIIKNKNNKIILSTNLLSELEYSLHKRIGRIKTTIKDKYHYNKNEFIEIKNALKEEKINIESDILEYIVQNEKELYKEVICYSEKVKIYYNNLYNILSERYLKEKRNKTSKTYYQQFKDVMKEVKKSIQLDTYKNIISTNPIYLKDEKIITAARGLESLAKLYVDIKLIDKKKNSKGLLYLEETEESKKKIVEISKEFERINFKIISSKEVIKDKTLKEIEEFVNG